LIKNVVSREKAGHVDVSYRPEGVYCRIAFTRDGSLSELDGPAAKLSS